MKDSDNVPVEASGDLFISVADIALQQHAGIVMLMQDARGLIVLSDGAMDALCKAWLKHRIGAEDPAA